MVATARAMVLLSFCLFVCQVRGFHIPAKMNKTIQDLLQHYKITDDERFDGNSVFSLQPLNNKMEAKRVFMVGVLETYEKLIGHMLKQLPTPSPQTASAVAPAATPAAAAGTAGNDVREGLHYLLELVKGLREGRYKEQQKFLQGLQGLKHIQMDNLVVQSKALWELKWLFKEANLLAENTNMERRRRRHARRVKTHLRA